MLHYVTFVADLDILCVLMELAKCDVNVHNNEGQTVLHIVLDQEYMNIIEYLVKQSRCNVKI